MPSRKRFYNFQPLHQPFPKLKQFIRSVYNYNFSMLFCVPGGIPRDVFEDLRWYVLSLSVALSLGDWSLSLVPALCLPLQAIRIFQQYTHELPVTELLVTVNIWLMVHHYGILVDRSDSFLGRNTLLCYSHFGWQFADFVYGNIDLSNHGTLLDKHHRLVNSCDWP